MAGQVMVPRPGGVVGNKYVLEAMLDSDATGAVFRARHATTGRPFAIRWVVPRSRTSSRPRRSSRPPSVEHATIGERYQNPLVLSPVDVGKTPHGTYIVMEWLNGETLSSRIACEGALTLAAAAKLLVPCMRAVHEMHVAHAVHGDLRPGNIFICRGLEQYPESVRVFDYSIAGAACAPLCIDEHGEYTVEAHFLAPEQITNAPVDQRADVYAFGVLLYLCVTGRLPFTSERTDDFARWIYSQDPPALPGAPGLTPALYRFLARAMARDAGERFESCSELADELEALARQSQQPIVTVQRARMIRSSRPTVRLASELPLPLTAANDPQAPHPGLAHGRDVSLPPTAADGSGTSRMPTVGLQPEAADARPSVSQLPAVRVSGSAPRVPSSLRETLAGMPADFPQPASLRGTVQGLPTTSAPPRDRDPEGQAPGGVRPTPSQLQTISLPPRAAGARRPNEAGSRKPWHPAGSPAQHDSRAEADSQASYEPAPSRAGARPSRSQAASQVSYDRTPPAASPAHAFGSEAESQASYTRTAPGTRARASRSHDETPAGYPSLDRSAASGRESWGHDGYDTIDSSAASAQESWSHDDRPASYESRDRSAASGRESWGHDETPASYDTMDSSAASGRESWGHDETPASYEALDSPAASAGESWSHDDAPAGYDAMESSAASAVESWGHDETPTRYDSPEQSAASARQTWRPPRRRAAAGRGGSRQESQLPLPLRPTAPVPIVPPPAAGERRPQQHFNRELPAAKTPAAFRAAQQQDAAYDPHLAVTRQIDVASTEAPSPSSPPLRFSPTARPPRRGSDKRPVHDLSDQPDGQTYESTVPLELLRPREPRRSSQRGVLLAAACFALFGIIPTIAYFAPPLKEHDALSGGAPQPASSLASDNAATQPEPAPATPPEAPGALILDSDKSAGADDLVTATPASTSITPLVDDPSTPIDESDPLIAAALAAQEQNETSVGTSEEPQDEPADLNSAPASPTRPRSAKPSIAPKAAVPPAAARSNAPATGARPISTPSSLNADPYRSMPTKRLPWETPAPRNPAAPLGR